MFKVSRITLIKVGRVILVLLGFLFFCKSNENDGS